MMAVSERRDRVADILADGLLRLLNNDTDSALPPMDEASRSDAQVLDQVRPVVPDAERGERA